MSPKVGIGRRDGERDVAVGVVRRRLVVVGDQQQIVRLVADVGDVEQHARTELALAPTRTSSGPGSSGKSLGM